MAPHVKSKRITLRQKHKVERKVRQHHRKVRRAEKTKSSIKKPNRKDPGIPNLWPYKQEMMESLEKKRAAELEAKKANQLARREAVRAARASGFSTDLAQLSADAARRAAAFESKEGADAKDKSTDGLRKPEKDNAAENDGSRRAFMKEFKRVVDSSDVILEVLDARDPIGCRCYDAERAIVASTGGTKRLVLVLNKVDLVPKEVADKWLSYLRNEFPTIAFRASVQEGRGKGQADLSALAASSVNSSLCMGAGNLIALLKNYSRSRNLKTSITVGIIGYPNTGKSSLINSLKRSRAVPTGSMPGLTRHAQEINLDKNLRLLDCPGIVFSDEQGDALVLRNCIKIEQLANVITPVETIIKRVGPEPLMVAYSVPAFDNTTEFLAFLCKLRGKYKRGGAFDIEAAARIVLQDWNGGKIPFYTLPPKGPSTAHISASVVQQWGQEFNVDGIMKQERAELNEMKIDDRRRASFAVADGVDVMDEVAAADAADDVVAASAAADAEEKKAVKSSFHVAAKTATPRRISSRLRKGPTDRMDV